MYALDDALSSLFDVRTTLKFKIISKCGEILVDWLQLSAQTAMWIEAIREARTQARARTNPN